MTTSLTRCDLAGAGSRCSDPGCVFDDENGSRAVAGRHLLAATLMQTIDPADRRGCACRSCIGDPFAGDETAAILRHVSDREAVLYLFDLIRVDGYHRCSACGALMPMFADTAQSVPGVYALGGCPIHTV